MFPISDIHPSRRFPFVNYTIIAVNILVFLYQVSVFGTDVFARVYGFIPARFAITDISFYAHAFYSMWIHGGWLHLLSNMWFLHIFGDNVEDRMGHLQFFLFYIASGFAAVLSQYFLDVGSTIPLIGASGAIAGVTGAYFVLFKRAKIKSLVPTFTGFWDIIELPAVIFLGYWFALQILSGFGSLSRVGENAGGVAFFAHIGGFLFGFIVSRLIPVSERDFYEI